MKLAMFFLILLGMTMGAKAQNQVSVLDFQGKEIRGVKISGAFQIKIRQSEQTGAILNIPARYREQLVFKLEDDGVLVIGFEGNIKGKKEDRFTAEIECLSLEKIDLSGACHLEGVEEGNFSAPRLFVNLSEAASVNIKGCILAQGGVKLDFSGAARFNGNIQAASLDVDLSGASLLALRGRAARANVEISGASKAVMDDCEVGSMFLSLSGASNAKVNATEHLDISGSGASRIGYRGTPNLSLNTSGATSTSQI